MKAFDSEISRTYHKHIRKRVPGYELCHELVASYLSHQLKGSARLLVAGSGTGEEVLALASLEQKWKFDGVEASVDMAAISQESISNFELHDQIKIHTMKMEEFQSDHLYDAALSILVSHFVPYENKTEYFLSLAKFLKQDGRIIIFDLFQTSGDLHETWMKWSFDNGLNESEMSLMRENIKTKFFPLTKDELEAIIIPIGLVIEECFLQCLGFRGFILSPKKNGTSIRY